LFFAALPEAVRRHRRFATVGDDDLREAIAKFFAGARDRREPTVRHRHVKTACTWFHVK